MSSVVRAAALRGLPQLVDATGGDAAALFTRGDPGPPGRAGVDHALGLFRRVIALRHGGAHGLRSAHLPHPPLAPSPPPPTTSARTCASRSRAHSFSQVTALVGPAGRSAPTRAARRWVHAEGAATARPGSTCAAGRNGGALT